MNARRLTRRPRNTGFWAERSWLTGFRGASDGRAGGADRSMRRSRDLRHGMRTARASTWAIGLVVCWFVLITVWWPWQGGTRNIRSDVKGYWAYLRALFITHDLGEEKYDFEYLNKTPTGTLNKYFAGESVMLLPFFLGAHVTAKALGYPADGYSLPYQRCIHLAALVYALIGLLCLRALLTRMKVRDGTIALLVLMLGFGTQLLQYTAMQPGWTHAYSFGAMNAFLLAAYRLGERATPRATLGAGLLFGLVVLVRPLNGLVVLAIPIIHGERTLPVLRSMFRSPAAVATGSIGCLVVLAVQPLLWHAQTGNWLEHGYKGEGFYWTDPAFLRVLFGVRRGLFVWTPVMVAVFLGTVLLWRTDRPRSAWSLLYWIAITWAISAWWIWYYGGGFGHRAFIDHYPVLLVPFALWLDRSSRPVRRACLTFIVVACGWHLMQFWQHNHGILHDVSMDREKYAWAIMRFGTADKDQLGGNDQEPPYHPDGMTMVAGELCDLEAPCSLWQGGRVEERKGLAHSGTHVIVLDSVTEFSATVRIDAGVLPVGHMAHLVVDLERYETNARSSFGALAVLSVEKAGGAKRYYETTRMNPVPGDTNRAWRHIHFEIPIPLFLEPDDRVLFYIWNQQRGEFLLDDMRARVFSVNPY